VALTTALTTDLESVAAEQAPAMAPAGRWARRRGRPHGDGVSRRSELVGEAADSASAQSGPQVHVKLDCAIHGRADQGALGPDGRAPDRLADMERDALRLQIDIS